MHRLQAFADLWKRVPAAVRKSIVAVIGLTLVLLGIALVVLPGPFTLPLLIAGFAVLGTEFAWASRALAKTKEGLETSARIAKETGTKVTGAARRATRRTKG